MSSCSNSADRVLGRHCTAPSLAWHHDRYSLTSMALALHALMQSEVWRGWWMRATPWPHHAKVAVLILLQLLPCVVVIVLPCVCLVVVLQMLLVVIIDLLRLI